MKENFNKTIENSSSIRKRNAHLLSSFFLNYIKPYIDWKVTQPSGFDRLYIREEKQSTCWVLRIFNSFSVAYRCAYFLFVAK